MLDILRLLNELNNTAEGGIRVSYDTFHLSELVKYVDIQQDYVKWLIEKDNPSVGYVATTFFK